MAPVPVYGHVFFVFSLTLISVVLFLIIRIRAQMKNVVTQILVYGFLCLAGWIVFTHISLVIFPSDTAPFENAVIATLSNIVVIISMILFAAFTKLLRQPSLNLAQTSTLVGFVSIMLGVRIGGIYAVLNESDDVGGSIRNVITTLNALVIIYFLIIIWNDYKNITAENLTRKQINQVKWLFVGIYATSLPMIPITIVSVIVGLEFLTVGYILISISMSIIALAYVFEPRVAFLIPDRVNLVMVVNSQGTLRYSRNFTTGEQSERAMDYLMASALVAIRSMMSEFYESEVKPSIISFGDQLIQFKFAEDYFLAVFCTHESTLINEALGVAIDLINNSFGDIKKTVMGHEEVSLEKVVDEAFYFVYQ